MKITTIVQYQTHKHYNDYNINFLGSVQNAQIVQHVCLSVYHLVVLVACIICQG